MDTVVDGAGFKIDFDKDAYDYVKKAIANMVESLGVSEACIRTISKEEYKENTENEYDEKS